MRIAYLCYWDVSTDDGVANKIAAQCECWRAAGHDAEVFAVRPGSPAARRARTRAVLAKLRVYGPELVYLRYDLFLPAVWRLAGRTPTVVELNSDDRVELRRRGVVARLYNRINRRMLLERARGIVCVTHELAELVSDFGRPTAVVANGADPRAVPSLPAPSNERPRVVFAGSPRLPWHGIDRLLALARALPELDFDVVGPAVERAHHNVVAHGELFGERYWNVLARADVAIGSLALDRAGLKEGCPLKVREYLLAGVPSVIGYDDTDFPGEPPWYLARLESAEQMRAFIARVRGRRVPRDEAEAKLSWKAKEAERLEFLGRTTKAS